MSQPWLVVGVAALLLSALIHAALAPEHFSVHPIYGWFFVVSSIGATVAAAGMLVLRNRGWIGAALGCLVGLIARYVVFRIIAPPQADEPESFDAVGIATQVIQVVGALVCAYLLRTRDDEPADAAPAAQAMASSL